MKLIYGILDLFNSIIIEFKSHFEAQDTLDKRAQFLSLISGILDFYGMEDSIFFFLWKFHPDLDY